MVTRVRDGADGGWDAEVGERDQRAWQAVPMAAMAMKSASPAIRCGARRTPRAAAAAFVAIVAAALISRSLGCGSLIAMEPTIVATMPTTVAVSGWPARVFTSDSTPRVRARPTTVRDAVSSRARPGSEAAARSSAGRSQPGHRAAYGCVLSVSCHVQARPEKMASVFSRVMAASWAAVSRVLLSSAAVNSSAMPAA